MFKIGLKLTIPILSYFILANSIGMVQSVNAQEQAEITVGNCCFIDGQFVTTDNNARAVWNASLFAMNGNGTITTDMTFNYLSPNPTGSVIYNYTTDEEQIIETEGDLKHVTSIGLLNIVALYYNQQLGTGTSTSVSDAIPFIMVNMGSQISNGMVQSNYVADQRLMPHPPSYEFRGYEVQLSWVRVVEDKGGTRYYQWLVGTSPSVGSNAARTTTLNDIHTSLSGTLTAYWPIPENLTSPLSESEIGKSGAEFDYVNWIAENANYNNHLESGTDYAVAYDYWGSIYWIIAIPIVAIAAVIGGIIGFRRWKRKA